MSTLHCNTVETSSGGAVTLTKQEACKVRFNYDSINNIIKSSLNASSVTDHGTGQFSIIITNNMSDADFAIAGLCQTNTANSASLSVNGTNWAAGTVRYLNANTSNGLQDVNNNSAAYFGDLA
jgi:hypothetical protein